VNGEKAATENAIAREARQRRLRHRRDVKDVEVRTAKHDARHFLDRHFDDAVDFAVWRVADESAVVDQSIPEAPLGVDGRAIRLSGLTWAYFAISIAARPGFGGGG
jgi:hypothetical protein